MNRHESETGRAGELADQIERREILEEPGRARLPGIRVLARVHGRTEREMTCALHQLRERGVVAFGRGKAITIPSRLTHCPERRLAAGERATRALASDIESGVHETGEPLPKIAWLMDRYGVSNKTMVAVLAELGRQGHVHKKGRSWVVGRARNGSLSGRTVILIQAKERGWRGLFDERNGPFCRELTRVLEDAGIRIASYSLESGVSTSSGLHRGWQAVYSAIRSEGVRYAGAIVAVDAGDVDRFQQSLSRLCSYGGRVMWYSRIEGEEIPPVGQRLFVRCGLRTEGMHECVVAYLSDRGHGTVAYLGRSRQLTWSRRRQEALSSLMAGRPEHMRLVTGKDIAEWFRERGREANRAWTREMSSQTDERDSRLLRGFTAILSFVRGRRVEPRSVDCADALFDLMVGTESVESPLEAVRRILGAVLMPGVTALLEPRDYAARSDLPTFHALGVRFPRDISVLSFDNFLDPSSLPVSSVSLGARSLGYRAAHWLLGDIPVKLDGPQVLYSHAEVIDRGSVATL